MPGALLPGQSALPKPRALEPRTLPCTLTRGHRAARPQGRAGTQLLSTGQAAPDTWSKTQEIAVGDVSLHFGFCLIHDAITSHTSDALN